MSDMQSVDGQEFDDKLSKAIAYVESLFPGEEEQAKAAVCFQRWAAELDSHFKRTHGKSLHEISGLDTTLDDWSESNLS